MALYWTIHHDLGMVAVGGDGSITRADIERYLAATIHGGAKAYAKLIELPSISALLLDHDDIESVAESLLDYGKGERPGPVAFVVHTALHLDMMMLLKQRVGPRPFRIFTTMAEAGAWLRSTIGFGHDVHRSPGTPHRDDPLAYWNRVPGNRVPVNRVPGNRAPGRR